MVEISCDLPDYLRSSQSIIQTKNAKNSRKNLKTPLTQGVSVETPDFFKVARASVLTPESRKALYSSQNDRFLLDLKQNQISPSRQFQYSDIQSCKFDYDSINCTKIIDLVADRRPTLKRLGEFNKSYEKFLEKGFGITRGLFTVEHTNPKILRNHSDKKTTLENILRKTSRKKFLSRESKTPNEKRRPCTSAFRKKSSKNHLNILDDLEKFEVNLPRQVSLASQRQTYTINKSFQ